MRAVVDKDTCVGCTLCEQICPGVFKMEDYKAVVIADIVSVQAEDSCQKAAQDCPVGAITIEG
jgi:ferredoxin